MRIEGIDKENDFKRVNRTRNTLEQFKEAAKTVKIDDDSLIPT